MALLSDANTLVDWDEPFAQARKHVSEVHLDSNCCFSVWKNWRITNGNYPNFILLRYCICEMRKPNRLNEYKGSTSIALQHFKKDGLEIHIDPEERCCYHLKRQPDDTFVLDKTCYCPNTRQRIRELGHQMPSN